MICLDDAAAYWNYKTAFGAKLLTPNLDRICAESTAFRAAYCQAPICGPSRASFMSAKMPHQSGIFQNADALSWMSDPAALRDSWQYRLKSAGYFCSSGGKVHHGYKPLEKPIHKVLYSDQPKNFGNDMSLPPGVEKRKFGGHRSGWSTLDEKDDVTFHDHKSSESAIAFFNDYDGEAPFYREIGLYSPHGPNITPVRFKEMYRPGDFNPPADWAGGYTPNPYAEANFPTNANPAKIVWWRRSVRNYFSAFSHGDYHIGRIWDALKASKHADNTIVIIIADHGFQLGNLNRYKKTTPWEQVAGVPFIVHDPANLTPREVFDPIALIDVGPTILDYAEVPPLTDCFGKSVRPLVEGGNDPSRVVPTLTENVISIRAGHFRLIRYGDGSFQLFDLRTDYWQLHDLGTSHPEFPALYAALVESARESGMDLTKTGAESVIALE